MSDLKPPLNGLSDWYLIQEGQDHGLQRVINELASEFGTKTFISHATHIGLLDKTTDDLDEISAGLKQLVKKAPPIVVEVMGIGFGEAHFQSVFLPIRTQPTIEGLNMAARDLFDHQNDPPYMPHFSGIYGDLNWTTKQQVAEKILKSFKFPFFVVLDRLALVDANGYPNEWKIIEEFPLTG